MVYFAVGWATENIFRSMIYYSIAKDIAGDFPEDVCVYKSIAFQGKISLAQYSHQSLFNIRSDWKLQFEIVALLYKIMMKEVVRLQQ